MHASDITRILYIQKCLFNISLTKNTLLNFKHANITYTTNANIKLEKKTKKKI